MYSVERYHDISTGHRVVGHEGKCQHLHGHNYRIHFTCVPGNGKQLDNVGRVVDFSVIKATLCEWLENHWDHKMLIWRTDPMLPILLQLDMEGVVAVPFNPTAENMAMYLVESLAPVLLKGTGVYLHSVRIEETRKCAATYTRR
jgi:6-pyruvoyltetrahydropterin/6-carboxytetrahydropterin synthase